MRGININTGYKQGILKYKNNSVSSSTKEFEKLFNIRIWRVKDVANFLNCSIGHIYNLTSDEKIPNVKKGKFLYFVPEEILNWVLEGDLHE
jgi:predicted DNA-binding transcriptional regulator AlpA